MVSHSSDEYNGFKVGDIITTYYNGFYELTRIERRYLTERDISNYNVYKDKVAGDEYSPMFHFVKIADANGIRCKVGKPNSCDASLCRKAKEYIKAQIEGLNILIINLNKFSEEI
jgi:hypothetical protein